MQACGQALLRLCNHSSLRLDVQRVVALFDAGCVQLLKWDVSVQQLYMKRRGQLVKNGQKRSWHVHYLCLNPRCGHEWTAVHQGVRKGVWLKEVWPPRCPYCTDGSHLARMPLRCGDIGCKSCSERSVGGDAYAMRHYDAERSDNRDPYTIPSSLAGKNKMWWACEMCETSWRATPRQLCFRRNGCPDCSKTKAEKILHKCFSEEEVRACV